ncbi:hypothetical protein N7532_008138 [Penicillium argentinense]|uniref:U1-type domain-containing protein n=1 Tax=Penicillium argentinense TaxID=1131581 RepID=A0A9W9EX08_9EURO|nr:uncharacterized protein N7532_008138 [Penicillium argentinense]KAJ5089454.1 hypothetical protein N7532_008138 [Penicillium argentinense]
MAEYWKSAPRHWCKQCKIFIRDTAFEKTQHEASPKHQGNLKRFLRDIHKNNEIQQRESQRAKSEVERLREAVGGGSSSAKGAATPSGRPAAPAPKAVEKPVSLEDRKKQMAQLAEMGVAIPQEFRGDMALAGEWEALPQTNTATDEAEGAAKSIGIRKRKHDGDEEDERAEQIPGKIISQNWGSKMRAYPGAQEDNDDDLDALLASTKDLKKTKIAPTQTEIEEKKQGLNPLGKKEDEAPHSTASETDKSTNVKTEAIEEGSVPKTDEKPAEETIGFGFKKRKPKVMRK